MLTRTLVISLALALLSVAPNYGHTQPIAEKPDIRPGDAWQFMRTDTKDGKADRWDLTIEAIESPDRIAVRTRAGATIYFDSALNRLRGGRADAAIVLVKYPLQVGDEWTFSIRFDRPGLEEFGRAKVAAYESLTVPAGTFQCYRVEAESTYGSLYYSVYRVWSRWYCPEIKWMAKDVLMTRTHSVANPAGNGEHTTTSVLIKFKPGP